MVSFEEWVAAGTDVEVDGLRLSVHDDGSGPVVTFLHDEAVRRTEEAFGTTVPLISATAETLREKLRPLVASAEERRRIGGASRAYVERVHDLEHATDRLLALYARL